MHARATAPHPHTHTPTHPHTHTHSATSLEGGGRVPRGRTARETCAAACELAAAAWREDPAKRWAALEPIKIVVTNWEEAKDNNGVGMVFEVQNSPTDPSMGSHNIEVTSNLYIDASDFRLVDEKDYYGLAPNKAVGLKYYGVAQVLSIAVKILLFLAIEIIFLKSWNSNELLPGFSTKINFVFFVILFFNVLIS